VVNRKDTLPDIWYSKASSTQNAQPEVGMISFKAAALAIAAGGLLIAAAPASARSGPSGSFASTGSPSPSPTAAIWKSTEFGKFRGAGEWRTRVKFGRGKFGRDDGFGRGKDGRHDRRRGRHRGRDRDNFSAGLGWSGDDLYRHNRTALGNGFFGDGMVLGPGRYAYDRGYPYDYYYAPERDLERDMVIIESPPRPVRCRVEMGVRVCGG
jgi:hypothetical protein